MLLGLLLADVAELSQDTLTCKLQAEVFDATSRLSLELTAAAFGTADLCIAELGILHVLSTPMQEAVAVFAAFGSAVQPSPDNGLAGGLSSLLACCTAPGIVRFCLPVRCVPPCAVLHMLRTLHAWLACC